MTVTKNGPFIRITLTEEEVAEFRGRLPTEILNKIIEAEREWEEFKPKWIK